MFVLKIRPMERYVNAVPLGTVHAAVASRTSFCMKEGVLMYFTILL
jgi:hypothetical protein